MEKKKKILAPKTVKYKYKIITLHKNNLNGVNIGVELNKWGLAGYRVILSEDIDRNNREYTLEKEYK